MRFILYVLLGGLWHGSIQSALAAGIPHQADSIPADTFPTRPTLFRIRIEIATNDAGSLRREPRRSVPARVMVDGREYSRVAVHLKGAQGSFRPLDEKPALTLAFGKLNRGQRFLGLRKIHLNNSVQDPTYLCEDLAGELFRRSGVPAARTAWAMVELNGRKLGLFVVKEGFTKDFLRRHFNDVGGNLYDGGLHREVNEPLELDSGNGARDHADLRALAAAAAEEDSSFRWDRLQAALDVDRFISFMAMEVLAGHIDGYCLMQNNYRLYFAPPGNLAVFLPHGTDRMFGDPHAPLQPAMKSLVAQGVLNCAPGAEQFRRRMEQLAATVFLPDWMTNRINAAVSLLDPVEPLVTREAGPLTERIIARAEFARRMSVARPNDPAAPKPAR